MSEKLLPCPFCGGQSLLFEDEDGFHVGCGSDEDYCGVRAYTLDFPAPKYAIKAWNISGTRITQQQPVGEWELVTQILAAMTGLDWRTMTLRELATRIARHLLALNAIPAQETEDEAVARVLATGIDGITGLQVRKVVKAILGERRKHERRIRPSLQTNAGNRREKERRK